MAFPRKVGGQTTLPVGSMTPLMYAARQGALDAANALVAGGANLNLQDPDGTTAVILAIINGHHDVAAMLVEKGADPNIADSSGMAALYAAVDMNTLPFMHGRPYPRPSGRLSVPDIVKVLLAHGADANQRLKTPLLRRHNNTSTQSLGEGTTPLMRAAASGDVLLMRVLLEHGADAVAAAEERNHGHDARVRLRAARRPQCRRSGVRTRHARGTAARGRSCAWRSWGWIRTSPTTRAIRPCMWRTAPASFATSLLMAPVSTPRTSAARRRSPPRSRGPIAAIDSCGRRRWRL